MCLRFGSPLYDGMLERRRQEWEAELVSRMLLGAQQLQELEDEDDEEEDASEEESDEEDEQEGVKRGLLPRVNKSTRSCLGESETGSETAPDSSLDFFVHAKVRVEVPLEQAANKTVLFDAVVKNVSESLTDKAVTVRARSNTTHAHTHLDTYRIPDSRDLLLAPARRWKGLRTRWWRAALLWSK